MNKRGFLLGEETVKLILAVIAILFLALFVVYLYNNFSQSKELEQAKSSLTHLTSEISSGSTEVEIYGPKDWVITTWPAEIGALGYYSTVSLKQCADKGWANCICICTKPPSSQPNAFTLACNSRATCQESDFKVSYIDGLSVKWNGYKIDNLPLILSINQGERTIQKNGA